MTVATHLAWRTTNVGRLLFNATDRSVRMKLRYIREAGFDDVSEAQISLYQNMEATGSRLTVVAERTGLTKSSMTELVARAEKQGLVERRDDPSDARAKFVAFTVRGMALMDALHAGIRAVEVDVQAVLGDSGVEELKTALISSGRISDARDDGFSESWHATSIGRLFGLAARSFAAHVLQHLRVSGHDKISEGMLALFRNLDLEGTRLTDLASRARMTKQSMREQVDRAEILGLVERQPDPVDQRAKIIRLTAKGHVAFDAMRHGVAAAELYLRATLGARTFARMKATLNALNRTRTEDLTYAA